MTVLFVLVCAAVSKANQLLLFGLRFDCDVFIRLGPGAWLSS